MGTYPDINCVPSYGNCYIDPLKCGTWVLTQEWALASPGHYSNYMYYAVSIQTVLPQLHQLQETIRGKKCEVHVSSLLRKFKVH